MLVSSLSGSPPAVSIILPTYNRTAFLREAFESIRSQQWTDWELIVVDDGSTDDTRQLVAELSADLPQQVVYIYQDNQGANGARNTGLDHARGKYIAFYDSDDLWLPHHLKNCVEALVINPDVDWVFAACRIVDHPSASVVAPNSFYRSSRPKRVLTLGHQCRGKLCVIDDPRFFEVAVEHGHCAGLQNSVIRHGVFDGFRFESIRRNEAEDQLFVLRLLKRNGRLAYFDKIHVVYRIHSDNSCAVSASLPRRERLLTLLIEGYETLTTELILTTREKRALLRRLANEYFWTLGYAVYWMNGRSQDAIEMFSRGMRVWPWNLGRWKTLVVSHVKLKAGRLFGARSRGA